MAKVTKRPLRFSSGWTARQEFKKDRGGKWFLRSRHGKILDRDESITALIDRNPLCGTVDPSSGPLVKLGDVLDNIEGKR